MGAVGRNPSLILAAIVGIRKSLYLSVAREDEDWRLAFGVYFCSISIFDILRSKG
jgi:hypothetical protein